MKDIYYVYSENMEEVVDGPFYNEDDAINSASSIAEEEAMDNTSCDKVEVEVLKVVKKITTTIKIGVSVE